MCDASLAALERLLMTPRHKFGPSHEWLANWNFPPPKAWAEAQRLAAERYPKALRSHRKRTSYHNAPHVC